MTRPILDEARIHPAIRERIALHHADILREVRQAIDHHDVVVIGMAQNPFPKRARRALEKADIPCHYIEYGNYFSQWRRRNVLKMWTGWPTFPMVFIRGVLVGGAQDLERLLDSGGIRELLAAPRVSG